MAQDYITAGSEYEGLEMIDVIVRPSINEMLPEGLKVIETNNAGKVKKTYLGPASANVVKYADGFQGGTSETRIQKVFELGEYKAENEWSKQDWKDLVQEQMADIRGAFQNDFFTSDFMQRLPQPIQADLQGMPEEDAILWVALWKLHQRGIAGGIFNNYWLGDKNKVAYAAGTFPNGTAYAKYAADITYNENDGVWTHIERAASTSPTSINEIKRIAVSNGAVAQVDTLTLSGTSGTATVTAVGLAKVATFDTDLTTTAANFVTANAAAYLEKYIVLTSSGAGLIFTSARAGVPFDAVTGVNATGDLAGSRAATTANTKPGALSTDKALTTLQLMEKARARVLKAIPKNQQVIYMTRSMAENYTDSQKSMTALESSKRAIIDGISDLTYDSVRIEIMDIDEAIEADFEDWAPHRIIWSATGNLAIVLSAAGDFGETAMWWNPDENKKRTRTQFQMGGDYFMPELMIVAY